MVEMIKGLTRKEYKRQWDKAHRAEKAITSREWYRNNIEKGRATNLKSRRKIRKTVLEHYGGAPPSCACCGESETNFLAMDHMNGGGKQHLKEIGGGGANFYFWLKKNGYPKEFQVLCHNCNFAKGHYGNCPHED